MRVLRAALMVSSFVVSAADVLRRESRTVRRPIRTFVLIAVLAWGAIPARPIAQGQPRRLNENCIVSVLNRNVRVKPDGSWVLPNIPANFGLVRARATCVFDGETVSGESAPFLIAANTSVDVPPIVLGATTPIPQNLTVTGPGDPLTQIGATTPLTVTAIYATGPARNITSAATGTRYIVSNQAIATITADGVLTALSSGTVLVQATNEGTAGFTSVRVVLSADSDGDGLPDDLELSLGLNPNNPADAFEDIDKDGASNRVEGLAGTNVRDPDSDDDGLFDGEELQAGADGYITNPLSNDTDGDGVRDALEVASGSNPTSAASINLAQALQALTVAPATFSITVNSVIGVGSQQLAVTGHLKDGTTMNLTSTQRGTNYASSNLDVCNFGSPDGRVFGSSNGPCTITITNSGFTATATGTVTNFNPTALSSIAIPGYANNVDANGSYAYVAAGASGLVVVNVANPSSPAIVASLDTPGNANDVRVLGNRVYIADGSAGLRIIDVTTPTAPVLLGSLDTTGEANDVIVSGNFAYVADGPSGLQIVDISNPASPTLVRTVDTQGTARGVDVEGTTVVVADDSPSAALRVIDVTTPAAAAVVGSVPVVGATAIDVDLANGFAVVAAYTGGTQIFDVRVPTAPLAAGSVPGSGQNAFVPRDVQIAGQFALFAEQLFAAAVAPIVDISNPSQPFFRGILNFGLDYAGTGIAISGPNVYWTGQSFVVSAENGTTGTTRLFIGQYIALEDKNGVAPTVAIVEPPPGTSAIEGTQLVVRADATDDVAIASVTFTVNGKPAFVDTSEPFEARLTLPAAGTPMVLGANAVDFGGNAASAATVAVTSVPDPLTTVVGRTIGDTGQPLSGVTLTVGALSTTSAGNGTFVLPNVPTVQNTVVVVAATVLDGKPATGRSQPTPVVPLGTTSVGDIVVRVNLDPVPIVPANPASLPVVNCIPFGDTLSYGFTGFIYRNVPAFELQAGDKFAFDLGSLNDVDIRRNIYFAVANINPAVGGNSQGVRALSWTKVTSETQTPLTPRGDFIKGNYELTYTADAPFSFPGGGFIVGFGGTPPGTYVDGGCNQVLVSTTSSDPSGFFHRRFYSRPDQTLGVLDDSGDNSYMGGIIIRPQQ